MDPHGIPPTNATNDSILHTPYHSIVVRGMGLCLCVGEVNLGGEVAVGGFLAGACIWISVISINSLVWRRVEAYQEVWSRTSREGHLGRNFLC